MALILDLDDLEQGGITAVSDAVWGTPTGREVAITSAATELPDLDADVYFEIRDAADAENNGLYRVNESDPTTATITAFKINGPDPVAASSEAIRVLGTAGAAKNVMFDTDARAMYLLEQGALSGDGATQQAVYSFIKIEWKADPDLIKIPFPMIAVTPEQFEYIDNWNPFDATAFGPDATGLDFVDGGGGNDIIRNQSVVEDSWIILGYRVGDTIVVRNATDTGNNGFYTILAISGAADEDIEIATGQLVADTSDTAATATGAVRTRKLIRTGGWSEVQETTDVLLQQYSGVISLGTFEDVLDRAYFFQGTDNTDTGAAVDLDFADAVNEAVRVYQEIGLDPGAGYDFTDASPDTIATTGDFVADGYQVGGQVTVRSANNGTNDGTYEITVLAAGEMTVTAIGGGDAGLVTDSSDTVANLSVDNRNSFDLLLRIRDGDTNGKTYDASDLPGIGVSGEAGMDNKVFRFPLSNQTDLKILETDANIDTITPYTDMAIRYFDQAFNREVDDPTNRDFGIVIDVGTFSGVDGVTAGGATLTSAEGGIPTDATYTGGTIRIHEGTDENTVFTISGTPTATIVTITTTFAGSDTDVSFTLQRTSPVVATIEEIYEFVQRQLRLDSDIDATDQVVTGRTADSLLTFVGDALRCGEDIPNNPQGGGSGVIIEGFDSNDTNDLSFFDNTGVSRTFPFVAAGTISFNSNLQNDSGPAEYFMFFEYTTRTNSADIDTSSPSGDTTTLTGTLPDLDVDDYIRIGGFADAGNNGIFIVVTETTPSAEYIIRRADGADVGIVETNQTVDVDQDPIDSPDALIVDDNSSTPIEGTIGAPSVGFDFDYDGNTQGGRASGEDADIVIRALGEDVAAFVEVFGTITRATGLSFSVVAPLERNFTNPA